MSAPVHRVPAKLRALLRERHTTVEYLGLVADIGYRRALAALSGNPEARPADAVALAPLLTPEELAQLAGCYPWNIPRPVPQPLSPAVPAMSDTRNHTNA